MQTVTPRLAAGGRRPPAPVFHLTGYTLVELLGAMVIVAILSTLGLGAVTGLQARGDLQAARAELSVLAAAIESFRRYHGSYPQTGDANELYEALAGWRGPRNHPLPVHGRPFLDPAALSTAAEDLDAPGNLFVDPWGNAYRYGFATDPDWEAPGFLLYSPGPDGDPGIHLHGMPDPASSEAADNLYARP